MSQHDSIPCLYCCTLIDDLFICSQCQFANYCSQACQQKDWDVHKLMCKKQSLASAEIAADAHWANLHRDSEHLRNTAAGQLLRLVLVILQDVQTAESCGASLSCQYYPTAKRKLVLEDIYLTITLQEMCKICPAIADEVCLTRNTLDSHVFVYCMLSVHLKGCGVKHLVLKIVVNRFDFQLVGYYDDPLELGLVQAINALSVSNA